MAATVPLILDVDTGIDDALAILYACASPEVELLGVTCVAGNVDGRQVAANTKALLELVGRPDVPVALGAERPLVKPLQTTPETHGPFGVGHAALPPPRGAFASDPAYRLLARLAAERPGEVTFITLGPLTNLALALDNEPSLPRLLAGWTFMGGAFRVPGNTTPTSEWNIYVDPDAAKAVLAAWAAAREADEAVPLALGMGLDVTEQPRILPAHVAKLAARRGVNEANAAAIHERMVVPEGGRIDDLSRFVVDALRFYFEFHAASDGFFGAYIHDPLAVAATLDRDLVRTAPVFVDVESAPGLAHAMTVADWRGHLRRAPNVAVATETEPEVFLERLVERLGGLLP